MFTLKRKPRSLRTREAIAFLDSCAQGVRVRIHLNGYGDIVTTTAEAGSAVLRAELRLAEKRTSPKHGANYLLMAERSRYRIYAA